MRAPLRLVTLLATLLLLAVACGDVGDAPGEGETTEPPEGEPDESGGSGAPGEVDAGEGITGEALRSSDVETIDDEPWGRAVVFAVASDDAEELWAEAGVDAPVELERAMASIPEGALDAVGAVVVETAGDGAFALDVDDGAYLVCIAEPGGGQVSTIGCGDVEAPADAVELTTGEAGLEVRE